MCDPEVPWPWLFVLAVGATCVGADVCVGQSAAVSAKQVVPINWNTLQTYDRISPKGSDLTACAEVLLNNAYFNLAWAPKAATPLTTRATMRRVRTGERLMRLRRSSTEAGGRGSVLPARTGRNARFRTQARGKQDPCHEFIYLSTIR